MKFPRNGSATARAVMAKSDPVSLLTTTLSQNRELYLLTIGIGMETIYYVEYIIDVRRENCTLVWNVSGRDFSGTISICHRNPNDLTLNIHINKAYDSSVFHTLTSNSCFMLPNTNSVHPLAFSSTSQLRIRWYALCV